MEPNEMGITPEQENIKYLQQKLEALHPDLYARVSKETLTNALENSLIAEPEFRGLAVQEALAQIGDAHTCVRGAVDSNEFFAECVEIDGQFFIVGTLEKDASLIGQSVIAINGHKIEKILPVISKLSSRENTEVLLKNLGRYLTNNQVLKYYGLNNTDSVNITTEKGENKIVVDRESKVKLKNPLQWRKGEFEDPTFFGNKDYLFRTIGDTLLLQYNERRSQGYTEEELIDIYKRFLETASTVKSIVVDLRQASGGCSSAMRRLFANLHSDNKIYVAMGRRTFSSGMHNLLYLKLEKNAKLIGENAGQKPNRFGHIEVIPLPNLDISVHCSRKYWELWPGNDTDVIEPDIRIPVTIEDYINNTDPLNQWIIDNL